MINAELPQPIADYFQAANAHKTDVVVLAFSEDALATDEDRSVAMRDAMSWCAAF